MENRKFVISQALAVWVGMLIASALLVAVFAVLDRYDTSVLLGAIAGGLIAAANHLVLILGVAAASGRAAQQDVKGGQTVIQLSYMGRLLGLLLILVLCAKSGLFNLPALVIPLLLTRPILTIAGHYSSRKGGTCT